MRRAAIMLASLLTVLLAAPPTVWAGIPISVEMLLGGGLNADTHMRVEQEGQVDLSFTAEFDSKSFDPPLYWVARVSLADRSGAWELQFVHHKLTLSNAPPEIQFFEISHGFNIFTLDRVFRLDPVLVRAGAGIVLAHGESTVRDETYEPSGAPFGRGYSVTGPALMGGVGRTWALPHRFYVATDAQLSVAWARVPVVDGTAEVTNVALHLQAGLAAMP
jgi:hypothetical protein